MAQDVLQTTPSWHLPSVALGGPSKRYWTFWMEGRSAPNSAGLPLPGLLPQNLPSDCLSTTRSPAR